MILTDTEQAVYDAELYELALYALGKSNISERNAYMLLDHLEYGITKAQLSRENEVSKTRVNQVIDSVERRMRFQLKRVGVEE